MKKLVFAFLLVLQIATAAQIWPDEDACSAAEYPGSAKKKIEVSKGVWIEAIFEITTKGNGVVTLPGLSVRVYDEHEDGLVFRDKLLRCDWLYVGGEVELVASGVAIRTDEKTGAFQKAIPVRGIFRYSAKIRRFEVISCSPEIYYWRPKEANQAPEPTPTTVTPPAGQEARQP